MGAGGLTEPCCSCCNTLDYWHRTVGLDRHDEPCGECAAEREAQERLNANPERIPALAEKWREHP